MIPEFLSQGEPARLFPVLSTSSKEGRTTSIVLACMTKVSEFGKTVLDRLGQRYGKRASLSAYTEIVFANTPEGGNDRPDGLLILDTGRRQWRALVETKVGSAALKPDQVERYRAIAKANQIDAVITISNQFTTDPAFHPCEDVRKSRSSVPVLHLSWMSILTIADLLISNGDVEDKDQALLLNELIRFLTHDSAGLRGFDRMPPEWTEINKLISAGGAVPARSDAADAVVTAWHQETKDLSLILTRQTETHVVERLSRKQASDLKTRHRDDLSTLRSENTLVTSFDIQGAAAPLEVVADVQLRSIIVGMTLRAPEDKVSSKARVNWLLRQVKSQHVDDLYVRLNWPGRSEATQFSYSDLLAEPAICERGKGGLQVLSFKLFYARRLGARFTQQVNFITDLEMIVPEFYREIGQTLVAWRKPAPKIKSERRDAEDVSVDALGDDATARRSEGGVLE